MAVSPDIANAVAAFQNAVRAAAPLADAPAAQIAAIVAQGRAALQAVDAALAGVGAGLDAADPSGFAGTFAQSLEDLGTTAHDATALADVRGVLGRAILNLASVQR